MEGINKLLYKKDVPTIVYTVEQVMEQLNIKDRRTFNKLLKKGLPHINVGRSCVIPIEAFGRWIERNTVGK